MIKGDFVQISTDLDLALPILFIGEIERGIKGIRCSFIKEVYRKENH